MRVTSRPTRPTSPAVTAESLLGSDHPLARASERRGSLQRQLAAVGLFLCGGVGMQLGGLVGGRSMITAAGLVEITLACSLLFVARHERRLARELIAAGRGALPLSPLVRERRRLLDVGYRGSLARSLDGAREMAEHPRWLLRGSRPLYRIVVIAAVAPQLAEVADALRKADCDPAGVAMTVSLLCDGDSPLYGDDLIVLRETLGRIRSRLAGC